MITLLPREERLLYGLSEGMTNMELAVDLNYSEETVRAWLQELYMKLGARNRTHVVALAYHKGLLLPKTPVQA